MISGVGVPILCGCFRSRVMVRANGTGLCVGGNSLDPASTAETGAFPFPSATRHQESIIRQLSHKKSGKNGLKIAADETKELNAGIHEGRLHYTGDGSAEKHLDTEA